MKCMKKAENSSKKFGWAAKIFVLIFSRQPHVLLTLRTTALHYIVYVKKGVLLSVLKTIL